MAYDFREGFAPPFHDNFSWNAHQGLGVRKEDGFVASLSWAEKGENISSVKPPSKAFHAFLSTPGESCSFGESHVGHKHQNTCTRQDQSRWLSRISVPSSLPSVQQVPFRMKGRQRPCSKNLFVPHLVFISPDGLFFFFGVRNTAQERETPHPPSHSLSGFTAAMSSLINVSLFHSPKFRGPILETSGCPELMFLFYTVFKKKTKTKTLISITYVLPN